MELVALNLLAQTLGIVQRVPVPLLPGEAIIQADVAATDPFSRFLTGSVATVCADCDGALRPAAPLPKLLLPGAFNPLHEGHLALARQAAELMNIEAAFELTILNADKPPLEAEEVRRRLAQFVWRAPMWLTQAPTFVEKARLFPGATFVVGTDTAARIVARASTATAKNACTPHLTRSARAAAASSLPAVSIHRAASSIWSSWRSQRGIATCSLRWRFGATSLRLSFAKARDRRRTNLWR